MSNILSFPDYISYGVEGEKIVAISYAKGAVSFEIGLDGSISGSATSLPPSVLQSLFIGWLALYSPDVLKTDDQPKEQP